jgi:predicted signal transduction protein with EAL and GGDEF domain
MRSISASIGVAHWTDGCGSDPERLIAAADQALYIAKRDGKNRYAVYDPQPAAPEAQEQEPEPTPLRLTA